jgi:glycerol-3-phosphate acyltransferase PlsY
MQNSGHVYSIFIYFQTGKDVFDSEIVLGDC